MTLAWVDLDADERAFIIKGARLGVQGDVVWNRGAQVCWYRIRDRIAFRRN